MNGPVLIDTGPLVASLVADDQHHRWACRVMEQLDGPLLTCEAVLTEAAWLLGNHGEDPTAPLAAVERGALKVAFELEDEAASVIALMRRYRNLPMSLAAACLVRMSEIHARATVFTTDSDFRVYRRHGRLVIPTLMPPD